MNSLPKLSPEQKDAALKKAQEVRSKRAQIRENLKAGQMGLEEILGKAEDEVIGKMRVAYLLESLPRIGRVRSRQIMEEIGIDESRRVQGLGVRQKEALLKKLAK
ncbi:MAG: integration host factor, actinobacterial type [Clostridia bacterium]|nr:integration host factor, actinobacterial type [Clostridia bacterium]